MKKTAKEGERPPYTIKNNKLIKIIFSYYKKHDILSLLKRVQILPDFQHTDNNSIFNKSQRERTHSHVLHKKNSTVTMKFSIIIYAKKNDLSDRMMKQNQTNQLHHKQKERIDVIGWQ